MRGRWLLILLAPVAVSAQVSLLSPEKLIVGGNVGVFRISFDDFSRLYEHRSGLSYGGQVLFKVFSPYYFKGKLTSFEKDAAPQLQTAGPSGSWHQRGVNLGVRYVSYRERRLISYLGFGFVFIKIKEKGTTSVFGGVPKNRSATGLYLDGGLEYRFISRASLFLEIELSSAGLKGKSGFQGNSVGGMYLGVGMNVFVL